MNPQLKPGASATSEDLLEFCRASVQERAACPVEVVILDQMPLTAVGKIFKPKLRLDAMRRVAMDIAADVVGIDGVQSVETPDTKGRPRVVVKLTPSVLSDDGRVTRLRDALNGFAFEADVR
jgi:fatty-acyl-CoA synthase